MRIRGSVHRDIAPILTTRGLPGSLLRVTDVEVTERDVCACTHADSRPVAPRRQLQWLRSAMMEPHGSWVMIIGTLRDPDLALALALEFLARRVRHCIADPEHHRHLPWWHQVVGGWHDRLRDDDQRDRRWREETLGHVGALVVAGATADCAGDKLEKIRDLLLMHEGVPRVVVVSGGDPLQFGMDRLQRRPDRVVHVNRTRQRADRDLG